MHRQSGITSRRYKNGWTSRTRGSRWAGKNGGKLLMQRGGARVRNREKTGWQAKNAGPWYQKVGKTFSSATPAASTTLPFLGKRSSNSAGSGEHPSAYACRMASISIEILISPQIRRGS